MKGSPLCKGQKAAKAFFDLRVVRVTLWRMLSRGWPIHDPKSQNGRTSQIIPVSWEKVVQPVAALTEHLDVSRHSSRALRNAILSAHHTVVRSSIVRCSASFWTPPSHYNAVVTAENDL